MHHVTLTPVSGATAFPAQDRIAKQLDAPDSEPATSTSTLTGVLSKPVKRSAMHSDQSYVLKDEHGRVLCVQHKGNWGWAYLGSQTDHWADVLPVSVHVQSSTGALELSVTSRGKRWNFYANSHDDTPSAVFASAQRWPGYRQLRLRAVPLPSPAKGFTLVHHDGDGRLALNVDSGKWNWLKLESSANDSSVFSLHRYYIPVNKVQALIQAAWPSASANILFTADEFYQAISSHHAAQIWHRTSLSKCSWRADSFDCEDFAFVYKGAASLDAYHSEALYSYAVGWIAGFNDDVGHAVNLFVDLEGSLQVIEPQTGEIIPAHKWAYTPTKIIL